MCLHFIFQNVVKWFNFFIIITCIRLFQCIQCLELVYALVGLKIDEFSRAKMDAMAKELIQEASFAKSCLNEQWTHLPLENEEDLINIWKWKRISNFYSNFMYKFYPSLVSFGTITEQDVPFWFIFFSCVDKSVDNFTKPLPQFNNQFYVTNHMFSFTF